VFKKISPEARRRDYEMSIAGIDVYTIRHTKLKNNLAKQN
jgi:hypothetical protein